ncbi:MAG: DUF2911 domain-containing protein [Candidatus Acidiferrales bacterium]
MKKFIATFCALFLALAILAVPGLAQQDKSKRPSPPSNAQCKFSDGNTITVDYSSPRMKGRTIYGDLVPWGKVWRLGANEATTFVPTVNVTVGDKDVPAGSYTLDAIPTADKWTLIVSKKTGEWGIPYPGEQFDLTRTDDVQITQLSAPVEDFTISFDSAGDTCTMHADWATTRASVTIKEKK